MARAVRTKQKTAAAPKKIAQESSQVKRARAKLEKLLVEEKTIFNSKAIEEALRSIKRWIDRYASERVTFAGKSITLFDGNAHTEQVHSRFVKALKQKITGDLNPSKTHKSKPEKSSLVGRIKEGQPNPKTD